MMQGKTSTTKTNTSVLMPKDLADFRRRYRNVTNQLADSGLRQFRGNFAQLRISLARLQDEAEKHNQQAASGFNVFELLGVVHDEVRTHSAFLADLLDPDGAHGQKHLFLKSFLRMCARKHPEFPLPADPVARGLWFIKQEKVTPYGCMDLVVTCPDLGFLLVIENKVMAGEQEQQLKRYSDWMETQRQHYAHRALVYLTPSGRESDSSADCRYFKLSYHDDIYAWLDSALADVQAPRIRETVAQYMEVIASL